MSENSFEQLRLDYTELLTNTVKQAASDAHKTSMDDVLKYARAVRDAALEDVKSCSFQVVKSRSTRHQHIMVTKPMTSALRAEEKLIEHAREHYTHAQALLLMLEKMAMEAKK